MNELSKDYSQKLYMYWDKYIRDDSPMPETLDIRPVIFESWKRSKAKNVYPFEVKNDKLSPLELQQTFEYNKSLMSAAHPYIMKLYSYVKGSNFAIALTDNRGFVLAIVGQDHEIQQRAKKSGLSIGCNRSEEYCGTNGIGTCLAIGQPIQIWGREHYIEPHHNYVCSAAPIKNQYDMVIGCMDVIGPIEAVSSHTLAMVCAAVDGIEKELRMHEAYEKISIVNSQLVSIIQAISPGIIMIDNKGIITHYNTRATQFLNLPGINLNNENLRNILDLEHCPLNILNLDHDYSNREITLKNCYGSSLNLSISASIIYDNNRKKINTVLVIEEQQRIHKLVSKMNGLTARFTFDSIIGISAPIHHVIEIGKMAAQSDSNVLILGESGTGKELLAQSIHNASDRANGPFIAINCGSLPKGLIESELFGYEGGAFTGANKDGQPGKFELASGGTIFLDEIGDMPLDLQSTLLRVIQTKEVVRIGSRYSKKIDVRIMAATNVNLSESVQNKSFRHDLYYRLNVLSIVIPPLRQRPDDIPVLVNRFIQVYNASMGKAITDMTQNAWEAILNYRWPGNVRELENTIERALNLAQGNLITEEELPHDIFIKIQSETSEGMPFNPYSSARLGKNREKGRIVAVLDQKKGNVTNASAALGIPKRTLYRKLKKYNIDINLFRL